ncbi:MAG: TetR/AcrR family transcriptional regulator [Peptostreptococcus sp.]|uniref:TetR/AcrR family transcriptional regulator n=1 Tax=Peptostreptococcus sp. TaxID=1262 RepID=UPI002FC90E0C
MNITSISREKILKESEKIVINEGLSAVSIRKVASLCEVSVGTIYNYFESKSDLVLALIESIWKEIFHMTEDSLVFESFSECINFIFKAIEKGVVEYKNFFDFHSMSLAADNKEKSRKMMEKYFDHIKKQMLFTLNKDQKIRKAAFNDQFTEEDFVEIIFSMLISELMNKTNNRKQIVEIVRRCIY